MNDPLVSVVIPTYNRRDIVGRAIDSALAQSYRNLEVIVVDDGSTDGTEAALHDLYGERIRVVRQENRGVSAARNHGMRLARGDFIALLDSDDQWHTDKIGKQVDFLAGHPGIGMVMTDVRRVEPDGSEIDVFRRRDVLPVDGDVLRHVVMNPALVPASILLRREVVDRVGGFDESLRTAEDIDFHLRVAAAFGIGVIQESLTVAERGGAGLSGETSSDSDYVGVMERFVARAGAHLPARIRRQALFSTYTRNAVSAFKSRRLGAGTRFWGKALLRVRSVRELMGVASILPLAARASAVRLLRT